MWIKKFFNQQFQLRNFFLQHDVASDFYVSCFQRSLSPTPLLIIRTLICMGCLAIWIASMVLTTWDMPLRFWPIYMTHWGLIFNTIAAGSGLIISIKASYKLPIVNSSGLKWYVQGYWATFTLATSVSFFITIFYWALLSDVEQEYAVNFTLDIFIHAVNSILMGALLFISRHPTYFLHVYIPIAFAVIYSIFTYVFYISGGTDAFGYHTIYPMIDWEKPGETVGMMVLSTIGIMLIHGFVVVLSAGRDEISRRFRKDNTVYDIHKTYY